MSLLKKVEELTVDDLQAFPVWAYTNSHEEIGETIVRPVKTTPVKNLTGRVVGTQVTRVTTSRASRGRSTIISHFAHT
jgi:hypothetical protein